MLAMNVLVIVAFALIVVLSVSTVIDTDPRMGSAPFEFCLEVVFAGLGKVS